MPTPATVRGSQIGKAIETLACENWPHDFKRASKQSAVEQVLSERNCSLY
jgi:hypothetical protein